jgi:hypothetical protein
LVVHLLEGTVIEMFFKFKKNIFCFSGTNKELMDIFEEMQNAIEIVEHINSLSTAMKCRSNSSVLNNSSNLEITPVRTNKIDEEYLSSEEWLNTYGLATRKLQLFDVLSHVAFRHCDGVVDIKQAPATGVGEAVNYNSSQ